VKCGIFLYAGTHLLQCEDSSEKIDIFEAVYLSKKNKIIIVDDNKEILEWFDVVKRFSRIFPKIWMMFSVYYDLKVRGRILKYGPHEEGFTMYKGGKPYANIFVLEETVVFPIEKLMDWLDYSRRLNRECIIAIVDKHGDVSYYSIERFR